MSRERLFLVVAILSSLVSTTLEVWAHCDTMDGPVVKAAVKALETEDVAPLLAWIHSEGEAHER